MSQTLFFKIKQPGYQSGRRLAVGLGGGFFDGRDQLIDDGVGVDSFGVGVEIGDEPVPQNGLGHRFHILDADVEPATGDGPCLCAEDQVLGCTRAGTPGEPVGDEVRRLFFVGTGGA